MSNWEEVRRLARGAKSDYSLDPTPIGTGGQADVIGGTHKSTGARVAFKRVLHPRNEEATARMLREIEVGTELDHPHVMPILDSDEAGTWLVMPLGVENLEARRGIVLAADHVKRVVESICSGVAAAHARGWIHRDLQPRNVLLLDNPARWVVADWGLVRRPAGKTTAGSRTRLGVAYGTEGFAPPELVVNAHSAGTACDVYSIGQLIGWCLTGDWPQQNVPLLPPHGPWRSVVRAATQHQPERRPQSVEDLRRLIEEAFYQPPEPPEVRAEVLLEKLAAPLGDTAAVDEILLLVESNPDNYELCVDLVPRLSRDQLEGGIRRNPDRGYPLLEALEVGRVGQGWDYRNFRWADQIVYAILAIATAAATLDDMPLLEKAAASLFEWDGSWNQWPPQPAIQTWLVGLRGAAAAVVADALAAEPESAHHFEEVALDVRADRRIRDAIRRTTQPTGSA